jgi:broad specificity phosphatase PhoE
MTTVIFVRHGQSESNLAKVFTGQNEVSLTALGREQAQNTARFLKDYPIDAIYSSDLSRAVETAEPTARMHGLEICPCEGLREVFAGEWEGRPYAELEERYAESYGKWINDMGHACPDGGESVLHLYDRVTETVDRLVERHRGGCIALFSHATPTRAMGCRWFNVPPEQMSQIKRIPNASVSVAEYRDDGSIHVLLYGYDEHQGDASTSLPQGLG